MEFIGRNGALIEAARRDFHGFYVTATPEDVGLMNALVVTHAVFLHGINTPREQLQPVIRRVLERTCDATERVFTGLRENVRCCSSFQSLPLADQMRIARLVFDLHPSWLTEARKPGGVAGHS
jgi:hypothetical protein